MSRTIESRTIMVALAAVWEEPAHESIIRAAIRDAVDTVVAGPHEPGRHNAHFSR